jgi:hypothetical protein
MRDSDATAGDDNYSLGINATDTGDGTEDIDIDEQIQIAGTLTSVRQVDADGSYQIGTASMPVYVVGSLNVGNASDTTILRTGPGAISVGGTDVLLSGDTLNDDDVAFDDANSDWTATAVGPALEEMVDSINGGTPNSATAKVHWSQLTGVPAGFADNTDDTGSGSLGSNLSSSTDDILSDNGTILLGGTGSTNNETLDFDFESTANVIALSSTSGATELNAGSFQLVTTGDIMGGVNISSKTAATYTVGTDDSHESYGTLFINGDNDAIDFTLPSAVAGMSACFMQGQGVSGAITVQPNTGDYLVVDGVRGTAATDYDSSGDGGDKLCVIAMDATDWIVTSESGTWSE